MNSSLVVELLMIIEMPKPALQHSDLREANQLLLLCAAHLIHPLSKKIKNFRFQVPWSRGHRLFSLGPCLWVRRPSVCGLAGREYHCFPVLSSQWSLTLPLSLAHSGSNTVMSWNRIRFSRYSAGEECESLRLGRYKTLQMHLS